MTFAQAEDINTGESCDALDVARRRLAESGEMAERAVRFHLAEAVCLELAGIRKELATLRSELRQSSV